MLAALGVSGAYWWELSRNQERLRADTLAQASARATQLADLQAQHIEALLLGIDLTLRQFRESSQKKNKAGVEQIASQSLRAFPPGSLTNFSSIDANGQLTYSKASAIETSNFESRDYFKFHKNSGEDRLFINKPVLSKVSGAWVTLLTRPMLRENQFAGVALVTLSPQFLADTLAKLELGSGDVAALLFEDGTYLARSRDLQGVLGKSAPADRPFLAPNAPARGVFRAASSADQVSRIYAWTKLTGYPLIIALGLDERAFLAPVERDINSARKSNAIGIALLVALTGLVCLLLIRAARQQQELAKAEARWKFALDGVGDGVWDWDMEAGTAYFSKRWKEILGFADDEIGTSADEWSKRVHPEDLPKVMANIQAHMDARTDSASVEFRMQCKDGAWKWILGRGVVVGRNESGKPVRLIGTNADISARKRSEVLLALEHAIARALALENEASTGLKAVMRIICESMNWARSTCWRVDEAAGVMRFEEYWDSPGLKDLESYTEHSRNVVFAPGSGLVGRVWQSGEPIWVADFSSDPRVVQQALGREIGMHAVFVLPVMSEGRTIGALAFFCQEVREPDERLLGLAKVIGSELGQFLQRKRAEDQVVKLNADLEQRVIDRTHALEAANKELEAFSYSVSHDLRAPLRAIQGFSSMVEKQYAGLIDDQGRNMLRRVGAGALKMGLLIDDLLKLSQISRQAMRITTIDLSALAWEVAGELQLAAPERKVEWIISPQVSANGDPGLLRVVLQNLMGNAWKYSSKREGARIEFGICERDGRRAFFVRDNGAGFDTTYADKLFGAFQRLHSPGEFSGTGIGLATVKRIVQRHGGEVGAESVVGEGATFYFTLWRS